MICIENWLGTEFYMESYKHNYAKQYTYNINVIRIANVVASKSQIVRV